jgi:hypothetical protein
MVWIEVQFRKTKNLTIELLPMLHDICIYELCKFERG